MMRALLRTHLIVVAASRRRIMAPAPRRLIFRCQDRSVLQASHRQLLSFRRLGAREDADRSRVTQSSLAKGSVSAGVYKGLGAAAPVSSTMGLTEPSSIP